MDQVLFTLPILPGQTPAARAFLAELDGPRKDELAACNRGVGNVKETWAIQETPFGDVFVVYMAGEDMARVFQYFATSRDAFDCWVKEQVLRTTGADMNVPPAGPLSEILADYQS